MAGWLDNIRGLVASVTQPEPDLVLENSAYRLRPYRSEDAPAWIGIRRQSRDFLEPWEASWPIDALSQDAYDRRRRRLLEEWRTDQSYGFLLFLRDSGRLIGGISLAHVRRGITQAASLGYWMNQADAGHGHMSGALPLVIDWSFGGLKLHRVEAACLPKNHASRRLLEKTGFRLEGYAERYLRINGDWQDHLLFGMTIEEWAARAR